MDALKPDYFDFFDIAANGDPPETYEVKWTVTTDDAEIQYTNPVTFVRGVLEDFAFGWNKETTYDIYRRRIDGLLQLAEQHDQRSDIGQTLLSLIIVLSVSGLETLVRTAARLERSPNQQIDEFVAAIKNLPGYTPIGGNDRAVLDRIFKARHAIIHNGWRWTKKLRKALGERCPPGNDLRFDIDGVKRALAVTDRFAACIDLCCESFAPPNDATEITEIAGDKQ